MEILIIGVLVSVVAMVPFGAWVAREKRRSPIEGALLGFAFGPLGVLVEALLPAGDTPPSATSVERDEWAGEAEREPLAIHLDDLVDENGGISLGIVDRGGLDGRDRPSSTNRPRSDDEQARRFLQTLEGESPR